MQAASYSTFLYLVDVAEGVLHGGLKHAHHVGPDGHSHALLAVCQSLKASAAVEVPKTGKGRIQGCGRTDGQANLWLVACDVRSDEH